MSVIVEAHGLEKQYGAVRAVDGLDLTVERGDVFGFLGPNGAGKSTTIRMMVGMVRPSAGSVRVFGRDVWQDRVGALTKVGALVESPGLYKYLSGRQNLWIFAEMSGGAKREKIDRILERVGLAGRADDKVKTYSFGMMQRLGLGMVLISEPELVLLDEPTTGLDPQGMKEVRELITSLARDHGITVFLSSHLLHEVEQVCTKVLVIHQGRQVAAGAVKDILAANGRLRITVTRPKDAAAELRSLGFVRVVLSDDVIPSNDVVLRDNVILSEAKDLPGAGEGSLVIETKDGRAAEVNRFLVNKGFDVSAIVPERTSLEDFYFALVGREDDNAGQA